MPLTNCYSYLEAAVLLLICAASHADPNSLPSQSVSAPFSATLHVANAPGKDYLDLDNPEASFDITVKNTSTVPQKIWKDWCSMGFYAMSLHITAINRQVLSVPVGIGRGPHAWSANFPDPETVYPGEQIERHIYVSDLPSFYWVIPNEKNDPPFAVHDNRLASGPRLPRLAGAASSRFETITAYATFSTLAEGNSPAGNARYGVWSGEVVSAPVTFKTGL